jgi:hypothetical protein
VCCYSKEEKVVLESLRLLDTIICYNHLPPQSLPIFIATLCHTANSKKYCAQCWKVIKKKKNKKKNCYCFLFFICALLLLDHAKAFRDTHGIFSYIFNMSIASQRCFRTQSWSCSRWIILY